MPSLHHLDFLERPGKAAKVVQDEVETLPGRSAEGCGIAEIADGEVPVGQRAKIAFAKRLADRVSRLRIRLGFLGDIAVCRDSVNRARGHVDEPLDAGGFGCVRQMQRALVIDLVGDVRIEFAERIVREFGHVHHDVVPAQVIHRQVADVLDYGGRGVAFRVVKVAGLVKAGVHAGDLVSAAP